MQMMKIWKKHKRIFCGIFLLCSLCTGVICWNMQKQNPQKTVSANAESGKYVYVGGEPIGIYMKTDGVFVVDTGKIVTGTGEHCCPAENIIKSGDYIQAVNQQEIQTKEELIQYIETSQGQEMILDVLRDGMELSFRLTPIQDETGCYRAGIWVRNNTQGIGTLTYVDEDGKFGALGHGISDIDTGELLSISEGTLFDADVVSVVRGEKGTPGELSGVIHYSEGHAIGNITGNTKNGIYGKIDSITGITKGKTLYETAGQEEIKTGPAVIVCTVDGVSREYGIEIQQVRMNARDENKGMILKVTDERLLEVTGGIVQGMSGSPIIQDGKLVGAVTHVLVNDPTRGYGIFIENMLELEA